MYELRRSNEEVPVWARTVSLLIGNLGFPIVVAGWFLYRIGPLLEQQTRMLEQILKVLERMP